MQSASLAVWEHIIFVKDTGVASADQIPEPLEEYAHWSQKLGGCIFALSKQNFWRIYNYYEKPQTQKDGSIRPKIGIDVTQGRYRLDAFKARSGLIPALSKEAEAIKSGVMLPKYDDGYQYKLPPLGAYQDIASRLLTFVDRVPLFADCGLGKTYSVLTAAERRMAMLSIKPGKVLVCGKLMTLETGWMDDCLKFTNLRPVMLWCGPKKNRKQKLLDLLNTPADIYVINHEGLRVLEEELTHRNFEGVIVDESTILKGFKGGRAMKGGAFGKSLMNVAKNASWRVVMSGTPAPNGAQDLWGQFHFLDPDGILLEKSYSDFKATFMDVVHFGGKKAAAAAEKAAEEAEASGAKPKQQPCKWFVPKAKVEEISKIIAPLTYRVKIRDHLHDLPEKTVMKRVMPMTSEQSKHYKNMKESLSTVINDERISVSVKLAQLMKLRQITSGMLIDEQENVHFLPDNPKLDMLDQLVNEEIDSQDKIIIYGQYQAEIEQLVSRYKDQGTVSVYGGNSSTTNLANIKTFINDPAVRIIVLHPKSAGHGITLTCSHYMIFASIDYSYESYYQSVKRIERASQKHAMFVYALLAKNSIDEAMWLVLSQKGDSQAELIDQDEVNTSILKTFLQQAA